jgi:hypothetical protein
MGSGTDPQVSGALSAVTATSNLRGLWASGSSNATTASQALAGFGNIFGFLRMLSSRAQAPQSLGVAQGAAAFPGCVTVTLTPTGGSATFTDCTAGGVSLNGTVSKDGDHYTASNLQLQFMGSSGSISASGTVTYICDLTASSTQISGTATLGASVSVGGTTSAVQINANFNNVTLCLDGTLPSGGSLNVNGSGTIAGTNVSANVTVSFGPTCGSAHL